MSKIQINESLEDYIREETTNILEDLKVNRTFKGYRFLITTAVLVVTANQCNVCITAEEIYSRTAKRHRTSREKVERNIRYVHENYQKKIQEYFELDKRISNKQLIFLLANEVEKRIRGKTKMFFKEQQKMSNIKSQEMGGK